MNKVGYEPTKIEVLLTLGLGLTALSPYYKAFVDSLNLFGHERVLEFGSGSGVCSRHLAARLKQGGGHLDCVDISRGWNPVIERVLWRFQNVEIHQNDIEHLELPDDSYDAVVVHYGLHAIPEFDRGRIVAALVDKLKPSGRLLLREPASHGLSMRCIRGLAEASDLHTASLVVHKVAIGEVIDGNFIDIQPPPNERSIPAGSLLTVPVPSRAPQGTMV